MEKAVEIHKLRLRDHASMEDAPQQSENRHGAITLGIMGLGRVERPTSRLSGVRSNHLSYRPRSCAEP